MDIDIDNLLITVLIISPCFINFKGQTLYANVEKRFDAATGAAGRTGHGHSTLISLEGSQQAGTEQRPKKRMPGHH